VGFEDWNITLRPSIVGEKSFCPTPSNINPDTRRKDYPLIDDVRDQLNVHRGPKFAGLKRRTAVIRADCNQREINGRSSGRSVAHWDVSMCRLASIEWTLYRAIPLLAYLLHKLGSRFRRS